MEMMEMIVLTRVHSGDTKTTHVLIGPSIYRRSMQEYWTFFGAVLIVLVLYQCSYTNELYQRFNRKILVQSGLIHMIIKSIYIGLFGTLRCYTGIHMESMHPEQYCNPFVLVARFKSCTYSEFKYDNCMVLCTSFKR